MHRGLVVFIAGVLCSPLIASPRPNVIVVMTDDQGYGDLGCHGNPVLKTPHLDRMHGDAVRFTDFHVSPVLHTDKGSAHDR